MTRGPLQSFAKDLTYFISIVGEVSIKLHIERPIITISSIVTESDKYSIELIKRVSTEVGRLISELYTTADHKVSMVLSVSHGDRQNLDLYGPMQNQKIFDFVEFFKVIEETKADFVFSDFTVRQNKWLNTHWYSDERSFVAILAHSRRVDLTWMDFNQVVGKHKLDYYS